MDFLTILHFKLAQKNTVFFLKSTSCPVLETVFSNFSFLVNLITVMYKLVNH